MEVVGYKDKSTGFLGGVIVNEPMMIFGAVARG